MADSQSSLATFTYRGPTSGVSLRQPDNADGSRAELHERMLFDGRDVDLPADHPHVKRLVAQGFLVPTNVAPSAPSTDQAAISDSRIRPKRAVERAADSTKENA